MECETFFDESSEDDFPEPFLIRSPTQVSSDDEDFPDDEEGLFEDPDLEDLSIMVGQRFSLEPEISEIEDKIKDIESIETFYRHTLSKSQKPLVYLLSCLFGVDKLVSLDPILFDKDGPIQQMIRIDKQIAKSKNKKIVLEENKYNELLEKRKHLISQVIGSLKLYDHSLENKSDD